jgi:hypothetical protein
VRPGSLRPATELAVDKPHGVRLRYMAGCRCLLCRAANSRYESERAQARKNGEWNGLVPAEQARQHLLTLSSAGIGRRAVAAASDVGETVLQQVRSGKKKRIRKQTETKILAIDHAAISDHAVVPASKTWRRITQLMDEGYTKGQIAMRLGAKTPALQIGKDKVLAITATKVERFYRSTQV